MRTSRFHQKHQKSPEVNLIPMMDVLMVVLTFFIIVSMVLTAEKGVNVALTGGKNQPVPPPSEKLPDPLIVELLPPEQIIANNRVLDRTQLTAEVRTYLEKNPKGAVLLKPNRQLQYQKVINTLGEMQAIGGSRVSLALEDSGESGTIAPDSPATAVPATGSSAATTPAQSVPATASQEASAPPPAAEPTIPATNPPDNE